MIKQFVPYREAVILQALGFDEPCMAIYLNENSNQAGELFSRELTICNEETYDEVENIEIDPPFLTYTNSEIYKQYTTAPLLQQAFKWFRDKHNMHGCVDLSIISFEDGINRYQFRVDDIVVNDYLYHSVDDNLFFVAYEDAETACLKKLIEILSAKQ